MRTDAQKNTEKLVAETTARYEKALRDLRLAELEFIKDKVRGFSPDLLLLDFSEIGCIAVPPLAISRIRINGSGQLEASAGILCGSAVQWLPEPVLTVRETDAIHSVLEAIIKDPVTGYTTFQGIIRRI